MTPLTARDNSRRLAYIVVVIGVAAVVVLSLIAVGPLQQRQEGVEAVCAEEFEGMKADLEGHHWSWLPPAWVCEFRSARAPDGAYERRLPPIVR